MGRAALAALGVAVLAGIVVSGAAVPPGQAAALGSALASDFTIPVFYTRLSNGLRVVVSEEHSSPIVTVEVMYRIGFRIEPKDRTGFAHLFEHMMFQGSANLDKFEHVRLVNENGGALNGSTRFDYTNYFEVMPANALELALWLEADRMRSLRITAENLENQKKVVSEEVRVNVLNQPYGAFEWLNLPQRANVNWYNAHNFYGDLAHIDAATVEDVQAFFNTYYAPANAVLVVTGDTTADEVVRFAKKHFGDLPSRPVPPAPDISEPPQTAEKRFTEEDNLARTPAVAFGYHLPERMTKDFFALAVLDPLLVGDESAKLYQELVKDTQIATSLRGGFNLLGTNWDFYGPMLYTVRVDYRGDRSAADVLEAVDRVMGRIHASGVSAEELRQAKIAVRSNFYEELEGGIIPGFGRANLLAAFALFDDDPGRVNTILGELEQVTAADVQAAARRFLVRTNRTSIDRRPAVAADGGAQ